MKLQDDALEAFVGQETMPPRVARDRVNEAMIRHWCDAMGDTNPIYPELAPPTMLQAWTLPGLQRGDEDTVMRRLMAELDAAGFTSVVATNCDQTYERYLRPGDLVTERTVVESISPPKETALGTGRFITLMTTYTDESGAVVGTMRFRILKFAPKGTSGGGMTPEQLQARLRPRRPRPAVSDDTRFFWDGLERGELLIQRCVGCGTLRHPPRPMCGECRSLDWDTVRSSGRGTVHSFVVHHHPPVPGFEVPFVVVLVDLEEGVRIVSNLVGAEPSIGLPVEVSFERVDGELTLPIFRGA
jgi:uncharacterized OB-fold protein